MIRIAIVDDEEAIRIKIYENVKASMDNGEAVEIDLYPNAEEFLQAAASGRQCDILYTDVQMGQMNGMELGERIRQFLPEIYIVFITSYTEYAAQSYVIEAYQYILKQDMEYRISAVTGQLLARIKREHDQYRMVGTSSEKNKVYYKDIIYLYKSKGAKYVNFVTVNGEFRERTTIEAIYQELDARQFVLADRGYIVNMKRICRLSGDIVYMELGYEVRVSRTKLPDVKREINRYWREL